MLFWARDSSRAKQVSRVEVAASHGVMSDALGNGVIEVPQVGGGQILIRVHLGGLDLDFQLDVKVVPRFVNEVWQWRRVLER